MRTLDGFYQIVFAGTADQGAGIVVFEAGTISGVDAGGVKYEGAYSYNDQTDRFDATIKMSVPAGVALVQGTPPQPSPYDLSFQAALPSDLGAGTPIRFDLPLLGPVNVQFEPVKNEIGGLFSSLHDATLRERCADLLSASGNFDRVINQATQVLEDRIRQKASAASSLTGTPLVNAVLKTALNETILKISDDPGEHEGVCHICRGVMLAFRNPTHHTIADKFSREDALKVCAFIDNLLKLVDDAVVQQPR